MTPHTARRTGSPSRRRTPVAAVLLAVVALAGGGALGLRIAADHDETATPIAAPAPVVQASGLDPELQRRFDEAAAAAAAEGVDLVITSGWRTPEEQRALIADAVTTHGSEAEAHRYVLPPEKSAHVQGLAIDVGPPAGAAWLDEHGATFGLCRTYENEAWHFEAAVQPGGTCPAMAPDSSEGW